MSRVKNISGGPLDVPMLDRRIEAGEVVDVPDFQPDGVSPVVWPPNRWEPVAEPKVAPEPKRAKPAAAPPARPPVPAPSPPPPPPAPVSSDPRERR